MAAYDILQNISKSSSMLLLSVRSYNAIQDNKCFTWQKNIQAIRIC